MIWLLIIDIYAARIHCKFISWIQCQTINKNFLFFKFTLKNIYIENYFNKIKCSFDKIGNETVVEYIKLIEKLLLLSFKLNKNINPVFRIEEQLKNNCLKIFSDRNVRCGNYNNINLILKISGVWINGRDFGITFRFFITN